MSVVVEEMDGPEPAQLFATLHGRPGFFFLDSGLESGVLSAYSFIGFEPFLEIKAEGGVFRRRERGADTAEDGDPLTKLRSLLSRFACGPHPELPFVGGAVGYFSYNYGAGWEITTRHAANSRVTPDFEFGFYDGVLAFNQAKRRWHLVANPLHEASADAILQRLREAMQARPAPAARAFTAPAFNPPQACEPRERYVASVQRIKDYIRSGDVYQVNLAHRFESVWSGNAQTLYQRLRERSPAPFAAFLTLDWGNVLSCSPERFVQLRSGRVETRPIKGTRPRGATPAEDERLARELVASAKDRAELLMIVDLERNDLGRVCLPGSIRVEDLYRLEAHPTVFHLVATVSGLLRAGFDLVDLLRATFPGGSITGAPKIRAMQIIDEIESAPREIYTGAIGYLGFDGNCDLSIAIRTIVLRDGRATYQVGAGIVWDSDPQAEYEETLAKGRALHEALSGVVAGAADPGDRDPCVKQTSGSATPATPATGLSGAVVPRGMIQHAKILFNGVLTDGVDDLRRWPTADELLVTDGLFETIKVVRGRPVFFAAHQARLSASCGALGLPWNDSLAALSGRCEELLGANGCTEGSLKIVVYPDAAGGCGELIFSRDPGYPEDAYQRGFRLKTEIDRGRPPGAAHKTTRYLKNARAREVARASGFDDALFIDGQGRALEGAATTIFLVVGGQLLTPAVNLGILPGVVRGEILRRWAGGVTEQEISTELLQSADEVFVTNALLGVMPVAAIDQRLYPSENYRTTRQVMRDIRDWEKASFLR